MNHLYYGDNLKVLRDSIGDESVDLIYLDPPFNSNASYNVLFKGPSGTESAAQIEAFDDTWHWNDSAEEAFGEVVRSGNAAAATMLRAIRSFLGDNDMMAYLAMMAVRLFEVVQVKLVRRRGKMIWTMLTAIHLFATANAAFADSLLEKCESPDNSFDLATKLFNSPDFSVFQLEQSYGAKVLVFIGLGEPNGPPRANWFITGRATEKEEYCYLGVGLNVEPLMSPHETNFSDRFGMPDSGFVRCSNADDALGGLKVRSWAAKELGDSLVLSLSPGEDGDGSFVLLISRVDSSWILLKQQDTGETCYFDRGPFSKAENFRWER